MEGIGSTRVEIFPCLYYPPQFIQELLQIFYLRKRTCTFVVIVNRNFIPPCGKKHDTLTIFQKLHVRFLNNQRLWSLEGQLVQKICCFSSAENEQKAKFSRWKIAESFEIPPVLCIHDGIGKPWIKHLFRKYNVESPKTPTNKVCAALNPNKGWPYW